MGLLLWLKIDLTNAFNMVDRQVMLDQCRLHFPDIYNMVECLYGGVSQLRAFDEWIDSQAGTHQGCPLGSFLFCLVLHCIILRIKQECPDLDLHVWYIDDGSLVGRKEDVLRAWDIIKNEGPELGLHLNPTKCQLVWCNGTTPEEDPFPEEIERYQGKNLDMLGSAIGDAKHTNEWVRKKVVKRAEPLLGNLRNLEDPQAQFLILYHCINYCRMVFFIGPLTDLLNEASREFDDKVLRA